MAVEKISTKRQETADTGRSQVHVDRADARSMSMTLHALQGIFWALNMLVIHQAADEIASKEDRSNGIANLIVAGERLADDITGRF